MLPMKRLFYNFNTILYNNKTKIFPKNFYLLKFDGYNEEKTEISIGGAVLYKNEIEIWSDAKFIGHNKTNIYSQYMGLIIGLNKAVNMGISELLVESNSLLIIHYMMGKNKPSTPDIIDLHKIAMDLKFKFSNIHFNHIQSIDNQRVQELCKNEMIKIKNFYDYVK